ncbi:Cement protein [Caenorhabditis elegans]|uniref:Cement protein n=1 Tax=Caenorhabditis elegans TaxID=6239 RepID=Q21091_CAEEL|nr:Cement protein [Caenorhabditis elegans]CAA99868.2 Cement protein [Caenorhabditis elegans]|eukprot:NP_506107.2 Uncharacterized protein CELE_K01D12.8 [Caenorhabditis elegans]
MISFRNLIILFGLLAITLACAPHMPKRDVKHGYCKFYIDGTSDFDSSRKKRDSSSSSSSSSSESGGSGGSGGGKGGKGGSGGGGGGSGGKRYKRSKKKDTKCYEYEDGSKDEGAVLNKNVKYTVTVTKTTKTSTNVKKA